MPSSLLAPLYIYSLLYIPQLMVSMQYLFVPLLALALPLSVIAALCDKNNKPTNMLASVYFEGWGNITADMIPFDSVNAVTFAFALTTNDSSMVSLDPANAKALTEVVQAARRNNASVLLSIGGYTGSQYFSTNVAPKNMKSFVKAVISLAKKYNVDGLDFDWEYPGKQEGCNTFSSNDADNFLAFLQEVRKEYGDDKFLTAAVGIKTFLGLDGEPMGDVSQFAAVLDYITAMAYDCSGKWSDKTGPNAPLDDTCAPGPDQYGSAVSAVDNWTKAGFNASQILLGVPAYGHTFSVNAADAYDSKGDLALYIPVNKDNQPLGPSDPPRGVDPGVDQCGSPNTPSGVYTYRQLFGPFLNESGNNVPGVDRKFDNCSKTPIAYFVNKDGTGVMATYDDEKSFSYKGGLVEKKGLGGYNMWSLSGDHNNSLLSAINSGMGIQQCT